MFSPRAVRLPARPSELARQAPLVVLALTVALVVNGIAAFAIKGNVRRNVVSRSSASEGDNRGQRRNEVVGGEQSQSEARRDSEQAAGRGQEAPPANASAGQQASALPLEPGLAVTWSCHDLESKNPYYECWLRVLACKGPSVHYEWQTRREGVARDSGDRWPTALDTSRDFNFFWDGRERGFKTLDTAPWLSRAVLRDLRDGGSARLNVEGHSRSDKNVEVRKVDGSTREVAGRTLPVMVLESTAGDRIVVVDDENNPLVVEIEVPRIYNLQLKDVELSASESAANPFETSPESAGTATDAEDMLTRYYRLISEDRLQDAYRMRSSRSRADTDLSAFQEIWSNNNSIHFEDFSVLSESDSRATVSLRLIADDVVRKTGASKTTPYRAEVKLVREDGEWRYDGGSFRPEQ